MSDRKPMTLVSVNVGLPKTVPWKGQTLTTGIFKSPVDGPVALRRHNQDGDRQADLSVHGRGTALPHSWSGYFEHRLHKLER